MHASLLALVPSLALAAQISVQVGGSGLIFDPASTTAKAGDVLLFTIYPTHNVAQSTFDKPCQPINNRAIYSGDGVKTFSVTVNSSSDPLWFYCATGDHCSEGMVMAVNPPANETISDFKNNAANAGAGVAPGAVFGGVVNPTGGSGGGSSSSGSGSGSGSMTATSSGSNSMSMASGSSSSSVNPSTFPGVTAISSSMTMSGSSAAATGASSASKGQGAMATPAVGAAAAAVMGGMGILGVVAGFL